MITTDEVLKAIVECKRPNNSVDYNDVMEMLNIDDNTLSHFLKEFSAKGYIYQTLENMEITSLGFSVYEDLMPKEKIKKSFFDFSKLSLKAFFRTIVEIAVALLVAYLVYHFGWQ